MRTQAEVMHAFTPQKLGAVDQQKILHLEIAYKEMALVVLEMTPESADRTAALRKLLESKMTCVQAISHPVPLTPKEISDDSIKNTKKKVS